MRLELSVRAKKLKNVAGAFGGTSDPFCIVTKLATTPGTTPSVLGRTEVIDNTLDPDWVKVFVFDYELGTPTKLAVTIMDKMQSGENKTMGSAVFDVGEVLGSPGNTKAKQLKGKGMIYASIRKSVGQGLLRLGMKGTKLKNTDGLFNKSDPFYELHRKTDDTWDKVFRSEVVQDDLNPVWKDASVELSVLCAGDLDKTIQVKVFDHEKSGKHVLMGEFETTVRGFERFAENKQPITMTKKGKATGSILVTKAIVAGLPEAAAPTIEQKMANATISPSPSAGGNSFVDYITGGCELNVCVAIDFTGSNGDPRQPGTLHHLSSNMNDYEKSISAVVSILESYDSDKQFPVLGFGAKYDGIVRHSFQVGATAEAHGTKGVLSAYRSVFQSGLIMSGPTLFHEVMQTAAARAECAQESAKKKGSQAYTILLILTDGAVSDVKATADCIDQISGTPLSIVIVGIGTADFSGMQFLDDMNNKPGKRDIVQFLSFRENSHNSQALTSATLDEIPRQLEEYFQSHGINALPPLIRSDSKIIVEEEPEIDLSLSFNSEDEIVVTGGGFAPSSW